MGKHGFNPQSASDEMLRQAQKIDNLIPAMHDPEVAWGILRHMDELRRALSALETTAVELLDAKDRRKAQMLENFLK